MRPSPDSIQGSSPDELGAWRARALYLLLLVLAVGGLVAYGTTIINALVRQRMTALLWVYAGIYLSLIALAIVPRIGVPARAWSVFVLAYVNAAASLARVGLAGSGRLYLIFVPVAAVILLGAREGWICLAISAALYAAFAVLEWQGILFRWLSREDPLAPSFWIESGVALALFLLIMTALVERFFARHLRTLEASRVMTAELQLTHAALEKRMELRTRELDLLNSMAAVVSGMVDFREILATALRRTMEAFDIEAGGAYELDPASVTFVMLAHEGLSQAFAKTVERLPLDTAMAGKPLDMERPITWSLDEYPAGPLRDAIAAEGLRRIIGVPLAAKGKLVGGMVLDSRRNRVLSNEEGTLLVAVGRQVGLALENARLLESEREGRAEANRRREVAEGLRETLAVLNSHRPLQEILAFIVSQACSMMKCDAASLFQLEAPEGPLVIRASCSLDPVYARTVRFYPGEGGAGLALVERKPVALPDARQALASLQNGPSPPNPRAVEAVTRLMDTGYLAILAVPLFVQNQGFGAIVLYYRRPREFGTDDVQLATSLADQASLAVENARLHEESDRASAMAERNRLSRELHDSVTQSLYSVTLYAEAAARLLDAGQSGEAAEHLRELGATARESLREMRLLIFELNPPALEKGNLADALQIRLDAVEARGGLSVGFTVEGTENLAPPLRQELYQIAQEALNNTMKHSRAQSVKVGLRFSDTETSLEISDDGVGFDPEAARRGGGLGLRGMRERVERCRGSLAVESQPGHGTALRIRVPRVPPAAAAGDAGAGNGD